MKRFSAVRENPDLNEHQEVQENVADLVRRSLIQLGDMEGVQARIRRVGERLSRVTPLPQRPSDTECTGEDHAQAS